MPTDPTIDSILDSIKKALGLPPDHTEFDLDVLLFINSAFGPLMQVGVGPGTGFVISDSTTTWAQYVADQSYLSMVKTFILCYCKLGFDPPGTSFGIEAIQKMMDELLNRILYQVELINPPSDPFGEDDITMEKFSGGQLSTFFAPKTVTVPFAYTIVLDGSVANIFWLTMTGDCTINAPVNGTDGEHITLAVVSNGYSVTWGEGWDFGDQGTPALSGGGKTTIISSVYKTSASKWAAGTSAGFNL